MTEFCRLNVLLFSLFLFGCSSLSISKIDPSLGNSAELTKLCKSGRSAACALLGREAKPHHVLPIMQGVSSSQQARFVVVAPVGSRLNYYVTGPQWMRKLSVQSSQYAGSKDQVDHLEVFQLDVNHVYELLVADEKGTLWDRRQFKALDLSKERARFALVSCMDDHLTEVQKPMWVGLLAQKPDAVILLGDTAYTDRVNNERREVGEPLQIWQRHVETRQRLELFRANPLIPVVAVWDDHDLGKNDGDRTFVFKEQAAGIFLTFFDQSRPAPGFERGPGVGSWWSVFGVQIALLDDRTFRSPNGLVAPDQTHFGPDQEALVQQRLAGARTPVLLASGDQFFGGYHGFESYEGSHKQSFKAQVAQWRKKSSSPIVFLSGDRHLSEIIKVSRQHLGYSTFEITSSGIHAKVFADAFKKSPSPHQLVGRAGEYNYSVIEIAKATPQALDLRVQAFGLDQKLLYDQTLMVKRQ